MKHLIKILPGMILCCCVSFGMAQTYIEDVDLKPEGETITLKRPLYASCAHYFQLKGIFSANEYDYQLKIKNGTVVPGRNQGAFTVYPGGAAKTGEVGVYYKDKIWNTIKFEVEPSPGPTLALQANDDILDISKPVSLAEFTMIAQPDRVFRSKHSSDATYRVRKVYLRRR